MKFIKTVPVVRDLYIIVKVIFVSILVNVIVLERMNRINR